MCPVCSVQCPVSSVTVCSVRTEAAAVLPSPHHPTTIAKHTAEQIKQSLLQKFTSLLANHPKCQTYALNGSAPLLAHCGMSVPHSPLGSHSSPSHPQFPQFEVNIRMKINNQFLSAIENKLKYYVRPGITSNVLLQRTLSE